MVQFKLKRPTLGLAFLPIIFLVMLLALNVIIFEDDASYGPNQIALLVCTAFVALLGLRLGFKWKDLKDGMVKSMSSTLGAILILLLIGALAGTWVISGIVPAMVYYGLKILNPEIFLFASCVISVVVSLATGSSWSTVATVGIALLGIGQNFGIHDGLTAGAIISGAYFGDKMSPLSDTTTLAPAMAGTDLFTHIKHMAWTTIPSILITMLVFLIIGFTSATSGEGNLEEISVILDSIEAKFDITPLLFLVPAVVIFMIIRKVPAIPSLLVGMLLGAVFAVIFQPSVIQEIGSQTKYELHNADEFQMSWQDVEGNALSEDEVDKLQPGTYIIELKGEKGVTGNTELVVPAYDESADVSSKFIMYQNGAPINKDVEISLSRNNYAKSSYIAAITAMIAPVNLSSENPKLETLIEGKGMDSMLNTIWLILCAMAFGGVMEKTGLLQRITEAIISRAKSRGGLIASTAGTCIFFNATASDQYLAIVVPGRMFASTYRDRNLRPENLSRTLEDSGTVTSALIPWNTCGAYHSNVLGVATGDYFMYAIFNWLSPIVTVVYGYLGIKVPLIKEEETDKKLEA